MPEQHLAEMAKERPAPVDSFWISPLTSVRGVANRIWYLRPIPFSVLLRDRLSSGRFALAGNFLTGYTGRGSVVRVASPK